MGTLKIIGSNAIRKETHWEKVSDESSHKNDLHNWKFQYIAAFSASLATLCTGTVLGWPSQITAKLLDDDLDFPIDSGQLGWIYSCSSLGAALLSLVVGPICDSLGRKLTMILMVLPLEIGWLLIIFAGDSWGGSSLEWWGGSFCVTVPLYIGEIAQAEIRGVLGGLTQFTISCGILVANILGEFLSVGNFSVACAIVPMLFVLIFVSMPESPLYLQTKGRSDDAKKSLRKLLGKKSVEDEFNEIEKYIRGETKVVPAMEILRKKSTKKALAIGIGLALAKVLSGIDAVTSYLSHIFDSTDTSLGSKNAAILFAMFQVFSVVPQTLIVDRWGRKILLTSAQFAMAFCLLATSLCLHLKLVHGMDPALDYVPVVALCLYTVAFSVGIGPLGWILTAEIFEEKIRGPAMSACTFLIWFLAFGNVKMFEVIEDVSELSVPFIVYGTVSFLAAFFVLFLVPETKNKSFAEIDKELSR
ncbi:hypothetical protein NQ318_014756 [Aromia moschata]|uniref:Major facilitator superfamily (MFS) profile domain-containing protein n=1 Tax=Aromia moschata TaxID=1265417 RepID=A0AAV8ZAW2_9CUCU|nr:hypothetical protein NQ318_014756 [Aromia moschata]